MLPKHISEFFQGLEVCGVCP